MRGNGGRAVYRTDIVEVAKTTELVINLAHDANIMRGLL